VGRAAIFLGESRNFLEEVSFLKQYLGCYTGFPENSPFPRLVAFRDFGLSVIRLGKANSVRLAILPWIALSN
jgi:hypothetical protein